MLCYAQASYDLEQYSLNNFDLKSFLRILFYEFHLNLTYFISLGFSIYELKYQITSLQLVLVIILESFKA
jgi:hypothetical protein